jgi:hypothetical protein
MRLTGLEIVNLIELHADQITEMAHDVLAGCCDPLEVARELERIRELIALLQPSAEDPAEARTMQ